ncbi:interleukin-17 receptor E [Polymixia lowei]
MTSEDLDLKPKIKVLSSVQMSITIKKSTNMYKIKWIDEQTKQRSNVFCSPHINNNSAVWEVVYNCVKATAQNKVSAFFTIGTRTYNHSYTIPDPVPAFSLSVDQSSRSVNVTVEPGTRVHATLCLQVARKDCRQRHFEPVTIDPSESLSALLNFPYLLPCVCVQVYYTHTDALRSLRCPFKNDSLGADVWLSSEIKLHRSSVEFKPMCPAIPLKLSASLCWKQETHLCTPVLNSTLEEIKDTLANTIKYNTSSVDKHPQMCMQFFLQGRHHEHCPFLAGMSTWEATTGPGRRSVFVYLNSSVPAKFSAQLCVLSESGCAPKGRVHSVEMEGKNLKKQINVPLHFPAKKLCVQVWQSEPATHGKRILCPDYTHKRHGMYAVAALVFVVAVALFGILVHHVTKIRAAGWLAVQKPVLLVCSSERSSHVSAVCALASILQGELCAMVRMALWAQSSERKAGARTGVADLGPIPWLYGQWEAVRKEEGKVLIIWSPEAKTSYEKWREERVEIGKNERKKEEDNKGEVRPEETRKELEGDWKLKGRRGGKHGKEKAVGKHGKLFHHEKDDPPNEPSPVTGPVFTAALACLQGMLQDRGKSHGVLIYFQGLSHSSDIPKDLRGIPQYCLPQDFRGLIHELGGVAGGTKSDTFGCYCWPRLVSKMLSLWLARRLANRLRTWLPQTQRNKMQGPKSSQEVMSDRTQSKLKIPLLANMTTPGAAQKQELLHGSP